MSSPGFQRRGCALLEFEFATGKQHGYSKQTVGLYDNEGPKITSME
jgi:hypothetical protein